MDVNVLNITLETKINGIVCLCCARFFKKAGLDCPVCKNKLFLVTPGPVYHREGMRSYWLLHYPGKGWWPMEFAISDC